MTYAKIIKDSKLGEDRLITFEVEFHRFILPELNTHRVFSRNYQSSRAVPVSKLIEQVHMNPATPVHWGKNQSGMVADVETDALISMTDFVEADMPTDGLYEELEFNMTPEDAWRFAAQESARIAKAFSEAGYHKQLVNRLLEPFMWTRGVITATEAGFESFFKLRCHPDAQPEIKHLAEMMRDELSKSAPQKLRLGEWHLPYVDSKEGTMDNIMISTSCVAQVSYRKLDDSLEKAKKIYEMLNLPVNGVYGDNPPHFSPAEHCATRSALHWHRDGSLSGNFASSEIVQLRKLMEGGWEHKLIK